MHAQLTFSRSELKLIIYAQYEHQGMFLFLLLGFGHAVLSDAVLTQHTFLS